jgi:Domain of unknown function (DUF397)
VTDAESAHGVWRKSTASQVNGNCVEVASDAEAVRVRHSRDPHGAVLSFSHAQWHAFLAGSRGRESDSPEGAWELPGLRRPDGADSGVPGRVRRGREAGSAGRAAERAGGKRASGAAERGGPG